MIEPASKLEPLTSSNLAKCRVVIKELMGRRRINATELARHIQLPQPTIHRLLVGKTEDPKLSTLSIIAEYFAVTLDQLLGNTPLDSDDRQRGTGSLSIPVISWQDAINASNLVTGLTSNNWEDWILVDIQASPTSFGLQSKRCMEPRFPTGSILTIDPTVAPHDGDLVIVYYKGTAEATIREIVLDGPKQQLRSITDEEAKAEELNENIIILGVVVQTRFSYK